MKQLESAGRSQAMTRRRFMQAASGGSVAAIGGAVLVPTGREAGSQFEATPPAVPELATLAPSSDPIGDLAASLLYDQDALVAFVRDNIHYETYNGLLRGPVSTLQARAGNSVDQAALLGALFNASQITFRYASGSLPSDAETTLLATLTPNLDIANQAYQEALAAVAPTLTGFQELETAATPNAEDLTAIEESFEQIEEKLPEISATAIALHDAVLAALTEAGVDLPALSDSNLAERERTAHTWLQVPSGPDWIDFNPTIELEEPIEPTATFDAIAEDALHTVTIRVEADEFVYGGVLAREVISTTVSSDQLAAAPVLIQLAPADAIEGLGSTINLVMAGQLAIFPTLFANGISTQAAQPMLFSTDNQNGGDIFSDGSTVGAQEGETVAARILVEIASPDRDLVTVTRTLLDRLAPADRLAGTFDPTTVVPLKTANSDIDGPGIDTVAEFNKLLAITADVARTPSLYALAQAQTDPVLGILQVFGPSLGGLRDGLGIQQETTAGTWSYPSVPNVSLFTFDLNTVQGKTGGSLAADLVHRDRQTLTLAGPTSADAPHPLLLSGVLNALAEHLTLSPDALAPVETSTPATVSAVSIFQAAMDQGIPLLVATNADSSAIAGYSDTIRALLEPALSAGLVAVIPATQVEIGDARRLAWWLVDPITGRTTDMLDDGTAGAQRRFPGGSLHVLAQDTQAWYARWIAWLAENKQYFNCVGNIMGAVAGTAAVVLAVTADGKGGLTRGAIAAGVAGLAGGGALLRIPNACL